MAERTYYDILEVSNTASAESITAAYERLLAKYDPTSAANASNAGARMQYDAVRHAYMTLGNAEKREQYDQKLRLRQFTPAQPVQELEPFWTLPKMLAAGLALVVAGGLYAKHQHGQARIEAEKAVAMAKAQEAEAKAIADAQAENLAYRRERDAERRQRSEEYRQRRERDRALYQQQREQRSRENAERYAEAKERAQQQREEYRKRSEESRVKQEEAQAARAARQQLARDRAELCRIERERYGKAISC